VRLIAGMKQKGVKLVIVEPWNDVKLAERIAQEASAKVRVLAPAVGAVKEADTYFSMIDYDVRTVADALR
jgi:ABC-type Zn uptake system ZnuABC Zn-binding protein ZnuA